MVQRTNGGVFDQQVLTGDLSHWVVCGANFSGAVNSYGQPVPGSAAEIIFVNISDSAYIDIMNPNEQNLSFALEQDRSDWDEISLTTMVQSLGTDVGVDHVNCAECTVKRVPYIWGCSTSDISFLELTDTPKSYAGAANYVVTVNSSETGLVFTPIGVTSNAFSFAASPGQPTIDAVGSDTLTFISGTNISLVTDPVGKSVTINSTASGTDYIPVPPATQLAFNTKYFVTSAGIVTLPHGTGSGEPSGTAVIVTKPVGAIVYVQTLGITDIISTDLGTDTSIEIDATQECIFIFDGISTWNLQIGSVN